MRLFRIAKSYFQGAANMLAAIISTAVVIFTPFLSLAPAISGGLIMKGIDRSPSHISRLKSGAVGQCVACLRCRSIR